jgi:hypothetical protein
MANNGTYHVVLLFLVLLMHQQSCSMLPLHADGWFNVVAGHCMFGGTVDGMGGDGDDEASALRPLRLRNLLSVPPRTVRRHWRELKNALSLMPHPVLAACCGDGAGCAMQAWLAAHMTLAVALRMMREELPKVTNSREAAALLQRIVLQAHSEIMQVRQAHACMGA